MTNFDIFDAIPQFESFASVAVSAERILHYRRLCLCVELPQGDGVRREVDVFRG